MSPEQQASANFLAQGGGGVTGGGSQPNFLENLIPTATSILGTIGGALIPGLGETGLGEAGGGAIGGALGQGLENAITGQNQSLGGAALAGGIGGGLGKGVSLLTQGLGGALERTGIKAAAGDAAQAAAAPYKGLTMKNLVPTMQHMSDMGVDISDPQNVIDFVSKYTGGEGAMASDLVRNAMGAFDKNNSVGIDLTGSRALANQIADSPELATAGPTVGSQFAKAMNKLMGGTADEGTDLNIPSADVYSMRQRLQTLAYDNPRINPSLKQGYIDMMNSMDSALTKGGVDNIVIKTGLTPEQRAQAVADGGEDFANKLETAANTGVGALRSFQKPLVDAKEIAQAAIDKANSKMVTDTAPVKSKAGGVLSFLNPATASGKLHDLGLGGLGELLMGHNPALAAGMGLAASNPVGTGRALQAAGSSILPQVAAQGVTHAGQISGENNQGASNVNNFQTQGATGGPSETWAALFAPQALPALRAANAAQPLLNTAEQQYQQAGGGSPLGILAALSGFIPGTPAYQYNQSKAQLANILSQAGIPMSPGMLPSLMSGQGGAQNAFGGVQGSLGSLQGMGGSGSLLGSLPFSMSPPVQPSM